MKKTILLLLSVIMTINLRALTSDQATDLEALLKVISQCHELQKTRRARWDNPVVVDKNSEKKEIEEEVLACRHAQQALRIMMSKMVDKLHYGR